MDAKRRRVAIIAAVVCAAFAGALALLPATPPMTPEIAMTTIAGEKLGAAELRGKVVLVNFWATTCTVCVKEMPEIAATHARYSARGLETVAVAMSYDPPNRVVDFAWRHALPFKVALDIDGAIAKAFGDVRLTPTTVLLDKRGVVVARYIGEPDFAALRKVVEAKLAEAG